MYFASKYGRQYKKQSPYKVYYKGSSDSDIKETELNWNDDTCTPVPDEDVIQDAKGDFCFKKYLDPIDLTGYEIAGKLFKGERDEGKELNKVYYLGPRKAEDCVDQSILDLESLGNNMCLKPGDI